MADPMQAFIGKRTEALATVYVTRRKDVVISPFRLGDLDLVARVRSDEDPTAFIGFGAVLWGTDAELSSVEAADRYANSRWKKRREKTEYYFPVVVLLFSMVNDKGYYAWAAEPFLQPHTQMPRLALHNHLQCAPFDRDALDGIVERVKEWYGGLSSLILERSKAAHH